MIQRHLAPRGELGLRVIRGGLSLPTSRELGLARILERGFPRPGLDPEVLAYRARNLPNLLRGLRRLMAARGLGLPHFYGALEAAVIDGRSRERRDLGLISLRVVTDAGVAAIVDAFDGGVGFTLSNFNYHALGTGTTAEAAGDTALVTELSTEYTGNARASGTQSQPAANQYRSVGTNTLDSGTPAVTEHGLMSQSATGGGTLFDRSKFAAVNLDGTQGDSLQTTYTLTLSSGS